MSVVHLKGARIMTGLRAANASNAAPGTAGGRVRNWTEVVEVTADDAVSSTYELAQLPSNARILGTSEAYWDDMATTGSPTLSIGVYNPSGRNVITDDNDAIGSGLALSSAGSGRIVTSIDNIGKRLWEMVNGQTEDPKGQLVIKGYLAAAAVTTGGTLVVSIDYTLD